MINDQLDFVFGVHALGAACNMHDPISLRSESEGVSYVCGNHLLPNYIIIMRR